MMKNIYEAIGYVLFAVAVLEFLLGIILLRHNPRNSSVSKAVAGLSFFSAAFSLNTGIMYVRAVQGLPIDFFARANWIGWFTVPAALQIILFLKDEQSRAGRIAGYIFYPIWLGILGLCLFTDLIVAPGYSAVPFINRHGPLEQAARLFGSGLAIGMVFGIIKLKKDLHGIRKAQFAYFFTGTVLFGSGAAITAGFLQLVGGLGFEPGLASLFSMPWVVLTYYAITRHRLFDIRLAVSRITAVLFLSVFYVGCHMVLYSVLEPSLGTAPAILVPLGIIATIFFGTPFNRQIQEWITSAVVKRKYDYQEILKASSKAILRILDFDDLLNYLIESMRKSLEVQSICYFVKTGDGRFVMQKGQGTGLRTGESYPVSDAVIERLSKSSHVLIREELADTLTNGEDQVISEYMASIGAEIIVLLWNKEDLQGFLALSEKGSGEPYGQSDVNLLETLAGHAAIAIENARLFNEARRTKDSLIESEAKFRALAQTTPAAIYIHQQGAFLYANPTGQTMAGRMLEELVHRDFLEIVHPDFRETVEEMRVRMNTEVSRAFPQQELKIVKRDGTECWVLMTTGRIEYEGIPALISTLVDITERKALEGKLRYAQKMDAAGKLAGGVAHDFNNIITAIVGYGNILRMKLDKEDPLRVHVDHILASTERAGSMTQSLLAFGKKEVVNLRPEDLNHVLARMEKLLSGFLREGVGLTLRYFPGPLPVLADYRQFERVIMNLLVNARDAIPADGAVSLDTGTAELDNDFIKKHGYGKPGMYAVVTVRDTGTGMDAATKEKIFDPFFSTKSIGKGTGLGLSIVYDIVKEHGGYITVTSEPGSGATFTIYLPFQKVTIAEAQPAVSNGTAGINPAGGNESSRVSPALLN